MDNATTLDDVGKLILRVTTGGLILFHGTSKIIHGVSFIGQALAAAHIPSFIAYFVYLGEVVGPIFLIFGLWPRIAALFVVVNMIVAIALEAFRNVGVIRPTGAWGLESEAFYLLCAVVIVLIGGGRLSVVRGRSAVG